MTFTTLRQQYPQFSYNSFESEITTEGLKITHHFEIKSETAPGIEFHPTVTVMGITEAQWEALPQSLRNQWVFQLGLAEIPSYWKATASPTIVIKAGYLTQEQIAWWHQLLLKGMGEYFYVNQIDFTVENFVNWVVEGEFQATNNSTLENDIKKISFSRTGATDTADTAAVKNTKYLIPIGGGKDSTLALCLLDHSQVKYDVLLLNPTAAMTQVAQIAHPQRTIVARRTIDPQLLQLNQAGYLNGHTPFSAYLGFLGRLASFILGHESIIISNERSSNEGNVLFHNQLINHQHSKTYEFEQNFNHYLRYSHLIPAQQTTPAYFSIMRPLYELQISRLFLNCPDFDQYAPAFRSCNRGQKTNAWCGECPKCLFSYISFYPFLTTQTMIKIFGQDLFNNANLLDEALALLGQTNNKPFECVGTHEESIAAFYLCIKKAQHNNLNQNSAQLPPLLQLVWDQVLSKQSDLEQRSQQILQSWNQNHQLPAKIEKLLQDAIKNLKQIN